MARHVKLCVVLLALAVCGYGLPECGFAWDYTQSTNFGVRVPGDTVRFTVKPPEIAGKKAIVTKGNCDDPGGYSWKGGLATWWSTIRPDYPSSHSGRFSGEYGYPGTGGPSRALTWKMDTMGVVVKVEFGHLSAAPQYGIPATRFENDIASGPIEISGLVIVTPKDQVNKVALRLAHNVKTLRQFANVVSTINMFQISTDGAWVKDGDSTFSQENPSPGVLKIIGRDKPEQSYWTGGPFSHPLHIVENHKNFLQYRLPRGDWITIGVVPWGWTADVYKDGETITTSGTIQGKMGYASNETPITEPSIQDIPLIQIPGIP